jgi:uncharacterized protein YecT (DUF1311 family)
MARREAKGPYMIYNGPIPEAVKARLSQAAADRAQAAPLDDPDGEGASAPALILLLIGTLAAGLALGLWLRPTLDRAFGHAASSPASIAVAGLTPAPAQIDTSAIDLPAPAKQTAAAASLQITTLPAAVATAKVAAAPSCAPGGGKADQMVCADPGLTAADHDLRKAAERAVNAGGDPDQVDWLVTREAAARRSPQALKDAYQRHIAELEGLAEPPH